MKELVKPFHLTPLSSPSTIRQAKKLNTQGYLMHLDNYCYLKVDDEFIHSLYPTLELYANLSKPEYFSPSNEIGAHISVIYPEEDIHFNFNQMKKEHSFSVEGLIKAQYGNKEYFALAVHAESLTALRESHHLPLKPTFKGHQIVFHITIGVRQS